MATSHPFSCSIVLFLGSYCFIPTMLNRVVKKVNRAQSGSSPILLHPSHQFDIVNIITRTYRDCDILIDNRRMDYKEENEEDEEE